MNNPTGNNPYQQAMGAYQGTHDQGLSGFGVVVELYKGMIANIQAAKIAYTDGKLDVMCDKIAKTNQILIGLQGHLDREQGGEAAEYLNDFYTGVFSLLSKVQRAPDPEAEFDRIIALIQPVYEIWCKHAAAETAAEAQPVAETPVGGDQGGGTFFA